MNQQTPANCPVQGYARTAARTGANFARAMRSLRLSLRRCRMCDAEHECPIRGQFSEAVHAAILSVQEELHLVGRLEERTEVRTTNSTTRGDYD